MKVAVIGASGFIGRHVLAELSQRYVDITASTRDAMKLSNVATNVQVVELDITHPQADDYERLHRPDIVIHLAWDGLPNYKSLHHFETELPKQYLFLKGLIQAGLPALLVTGTCLEYGFQSSELSEDLAPLPCTPYGYAKDALRKQLEFLREKHPFNLTWARLFYTYGMGQSKSALLSQLKDAVAHKEPTFNMSGGEQLRDYMPVTDVAYILVNLAISQKDIGIVNVCSGKPVSVRNMVERWIKDNKWAIALNVGHFPYPDYEPMSFWGSRVRLNAILERI